MSRDDTTSLDILNAARLAIKFMGPATKADFFRDEKTQSAVLHQLLILGEAVTRLSDEFRATLPDIPWRMIAGMRDKLTHEYNAVDLDEVWNSVIVDCPKLIAALEGKAQRRGWSIGGVHPE